MTTTSSKYRAEPTTVDGIRFASRAEARRYQELKLLRAAGAIRDLKVHPRYPLRVFGVNLGRYEADFEYRENGRLMVEDVKGMALPVYRLKKKLMLALYGIEVQEIRAALTQKG